MKYLTPFLIAAGLAGLSVLVLGVPAVFNLPAQTDPEHPTEVLALPEIEEETRQDFTVCDPDVLLLSMEQFHQANQSIVEEIELDIINELAFGDDSSCDDASSELALSESDLNLGAKASSLSQDIPDNRKCRYNSQAKHDECGIAARGPSCQGSNTPSLLDDKCCDWKLKPDGTRDSCQCNTSVVNLCQNPGVDNDEVCSICMLMAEASTERYDWCKQMVLCTIRERRKWNNDASICETNARRSGDASWFTPDKCTCDRTAPNKNKTKNTYNNQYCECKEALCNGGTYYNYQQYLPLLSASCPKNSPNFYNACGTDPCPGRGDEIKPPSGISCKHRFYRCQAS